MSNIKTNIKEPSVSVVMPIYNHSRAQLLAAVNSILTQTLTDFELIIVDGNPDNSNYKIIHNLDDKRIKYFKTIGYINCLNLGIRKSRGKYIARMDSDDISLPTRLQKQFDFLETHPEADLCSCKAKLFGDIKPRDSAYISDLSLVGLISHSDFIHPAMMFRRSLNLQYEHIKPVEDCLLFRKLILDGKKMVILNHTLFKNNVSSESLMARHPELTALQVAKTNVWSIAKYLNYPLSFTDSIMKKRCFLKQEISEFLDFSKTAQKALPSLDIMKLFAPYLRFISSHTDFNIYTASAYYKTYFSYDCKQILKKTAKFLFTVKNERINGVKYKIVQFCGYKIKLSVKKYA